MRLTNALPVLLCAVLVGSVALAGAGVAAPATNDSTAASGPSVEALTVQDESTIGGWFYPDQTNLVTQWSVAEGDAALSEVTVEVIDENGDVVASYDGAQGGERYVKDGSFGNEYTVELTATDANGNSVCQRVVGPADGNDNFESESCEDGSAEFEITDLSLDKESASPGETVRVTADVKNTGDASSSVLAVLTADGEVKEGINGLTEEIDPGETRSVSLAYSFDEPGDHTLGIDLPYADGVGPQTVTVEGDAEFEVSDLSLDKDSAATGETVRVTAELENVGDATGGQLVTLTVDGNAQDGLNTFTGDVKPGETTSVSLAYSFDEAGEYDLGVDQSYAKGVGPQTVTVEGESEFKITDLSLDKESASPGETVRVTADVKNTGDASGSVLAVLTADGEVKEGINGLTEEIDPGETRSVSLAYSFDEPGDHTLGIDLPYADGVGPQTVTVEGDAEFEVTDVSLDKDSAATGETVRVTAELENVGDATGGQLVTLTIDGNAQAGLNSFTGDVKPGEATTVSFAYSFDEAGEYDLGVDQPYAKGVGPQTVTVEGDSEFLVTDVSVDKELATPGETVRVTADVKNTGDASGSVLAVLVADGEVKEGINGLTEEIEPGETRSVSLAYGFDEPGDHTLGVDLPYADGVSDAPVTVVGDQEGPEINYFEISSDDSSAGYWIYPSEASFEADWAVSEGDAALSDVTVEVIDEDGNVVQTASGAQDSLEYYEEGAFLEEFTVELTATDENGQTTCAQLTGPADGDASNFEQSDC